MSFRKRSASVLLMVPHAARRNAALLPGDFGRLGRLLKSPGVRRGRCSTFSSIVTIIQGKVSANPRTGNPLFKPRQVRSQPRNPENLAVPAFKRHRGEASEAEMKPTGRSERSRRSLAATGGSAVLAIFQVCAPVVAFSPEGQASRPPQRCAPREWATAKLVGAGRENVPKTIFSKLLVGRRDNLQNLEMP